VKLYGTTKSGGGGSKLAPLVEVEGAENGDVTRKSGGFNGSSSFSTGATTSVSSNKNTAVNTNSHTTVSNPGFQVNTLPKGTAGFPSVSTGVSVSTGSSVSTGVLSSSSMSAGQQYKSISKGGNSATTGASTTPNVNGISTSSATSSSPMATTTSAPTTPVTSQSAAILSPSGDVTSSVVKQPVSKPVITMNNSDSLYMASEVGTASRQKKTPEPSDDDDFKRQDLNPVSRRILEEKYTTHDDFYQLNTKVLDEGSLLKQDVNDIYRKAGESLTYEQLLQGMLVDGERFLLGSCWLYYTHVQFTDVDGKKVVREPYGRGRIGLTSKRALFLSTETYTDANLEEFGDPKTPSGGYKLEVAKMSSVVFKNIPLSNFHSAEMEVLNGTAAQTKITRQSKCCGCLASPFPNTFLQWVCLFKHQWASTPPMTRSITSRVMRLGVSMPPWQTRMYLDVTLDPTMSLTVARDFISQLHSFAPHMH